MAQLFLKNSAGTRLDHAGIVPIYEIGEADGNHFFSMKFIDGSALSDCLEAVQHAYQRGVRHRDLKPANVGGNSVAKNSLDHAQELTMGVREVSTKDGNDSSWVNWLVFQFQILEREAVAKLN